MDQVSSVVVKNLQMLVLMLLLQWTPDKNVLNTQSEVPALKRYKCDVGVEKDVENLFQSIHNDFGRRADVVL